MRARAFEAIAIAVCVAVVAVLFVKWTHRRPSHGGDSAAPSLDRAAAPGEPAASRELSSAAPRPFRPPVEHVTFIHGHPNPIIERVRVDKLEVCLGEENFAHPDVHTVDGTDADLRISLAGTGFLGRGSTGGKLPFRFLKPMDPTAMPVVIVEGPNGTHAEQRLPYIKVKDCTAAPPLRLEGQQVPNRGPDVFAFQVTGAPAGSVVQWDFGDGSRASTTEPRVEHDFHDRRQRTRFSEFLVTAHATDPAGQTTSGSTTIELFNRAYWASRSQR
jgi:hypothetical protein